MRFAQFHHLLGETAHPLWFYAYPVEVKSDETEVDGYLPNMRPNLPSQSKRLLQTIQVPGLRQRMPKRPAFIQAEKAKNMTEITIRLLDNGGVQIGQPELAKLQEWQRQTGSTLMFTHIGQSDEPDTNELCQNSLFAGD